MKGISIMNKIISFIFFSLLLLIASGVFSQEPSPPATKGQPGEIASEQNTGGNIESNKNTNISTKPSLPPYKMETQQSYRASQTANKEDSGKEPFIMDDGYTLVLTFFTGALVICNIALWIYTRRAANAAKRSADSLPITERAYLFVYSIVWPKGESGFTLSEYNKHTPIKLIITNVGRTPAILCNVSAKVSIKESEYPTKEAIRGKLEIAFPSGVIIKSDEREEIFCGEVLGPSIMTESKFSQSTILCYGYIIYEDIFGKSHETGFCYEFKPTYSDGRFRISQNRELNYHT
jgi:hypothetical protein